MCLEPKITPHYHEGARFYPYDFPSRLREMENQNIREKNRSELVLIRVDGNTVCVSYLSLVFLLGQNVNAEKV